MTSYGEGSTSASYTYTADGLRAAKTVNGTSEAYTWDVVEGLPLIIQDGTTKEITGPAGLPIEQIDGSGKVTYYLQDQLGSTRGTIDAAGNIVGTATYDAYGNVKGTSTTGTAFGYAGQYTDAESGLQYLRARYYDPSTEQFLTVDPLADLTSEPYGYAGDDAVNWVDPSGLCSVGPVSLPFGTSGQCSNDLGAGAFNAVSFLLNRTASTAYSGVNSSDEDAIAAQDRACGTGAALSAIDTASNMLLFLSMFDGEGEALEATSYVVDSARMAPHMTGSLAAGKSRFLFNVNARQLVIDAARFADKHGLWKDGKAKVFVTNGPIGVVADTGELTNWVNVYRRASGWIHGSPGNAP